MQRAATAPQLAKWERESGQDSLIVEGDYCSESLHAEDTRRERAAQQRNALLALASGDCVALPRANDSGFLAHWELGRGYPPGRGGAACI